MKFIKKIYYTMLASIFFYAQQAKAGFFSQDLKTQVEEDARDLGSRAGFDTTQQAGASIAGLIGVFLSLLGIIFVILIIIAGFNWMIAGGDEEKVRKAKHIINRAIIGLIIILAAYSITYFVFRNLPGGTGGGAGGGATAPSFPIGG